MTKHLHFNKLPEAPSEWLKNGTLRVISSDYGEPDLYWETSKTATELHGLAVKEVEGGYMLYRYHRSTSFGYGG